ncbi:hypothetical protein [Psychrobium sp. 1_MG-2023]|uniref:hypothetical protein n=1 Tax=Psychrobium sp. 1_MG-2023 TaxID=3062624 RepID=UPI000C32AC1B|nr:hypothetical protein [Psychrobium sp. 1_MG-2023]MDP2561593.1 hypothetical protein [Psychrobium sp. 1_MG-2023]PKF55614.1 hypothetical protein CW748_12190 [Alteromonadales bacterium alter-6D02]
MSRLLLITFLVLLSSACVFVPEQTVPSQLIRPCDTITKKYTLEVKEVESLDCAGNAIGCLVAVAGAPAASLVVSGSVVLVGNTLHWLEYHSRCEGGAVDKLMNIELLDNKGTG